METTDNTLNEMQQQMQLLKDKLSKQTIVNEQMMRNAFGKGIKDLRSNYSVKTIAAIAGMLGCPSFYNLGCSLYFVIFGELMMLIALVATLYANRLIPRMDDDLLTAAGNLTRFRKINAEWIKYGIPTMVVWLGWLIVELFSGEEFTAGQAYAMIGGIAVGLTVGMCIGLRIRREIMRGVDELMAQIKEMQNM
ncbi:MAG: hypothetical protein IKM90_05920 [Bacteroidaceae bacterium]|jgi:hypothetical protein|nr:hypothetical protein [Bacteroidaceae bacterium]